MIADNKCLFTISSILHPFLHVFVIHPESHCGKKMVEVHLTDLGNIFSLIHIGLMHSLYLSYGCIIKENHFFVAGHLGRFQLFLYYKQCHTEHPHICCLCVCPSSEDAEKWDW